MFFPFLSQQEVAASPPCGCILICGWDAMLRSPRVHLWGSDLVERLLNVENGLDLEPQPCKNKQANKYIGQCKSQLSLNSIPNFMWHACHLMTFGTVALQEDAFRLYDSNNLMAFEMFLH